MDLDLDVLVLDNLNDVGLLAASDSDLSVEALKFIDDNWYKKIAGRKARWMDLIGDYAGNERFILDGDVISSRCGQPFADVPARRRIVAPAGSW